MCNAKNNYFAKFLTRSILETIVHLPLILSSVKVAKLPLFGKELFTRLNVHSLCGLSIKAAVTPGLGSLKTTLRPL